MTATTGTQEGPRKASRPIFIVGCARSGTTLLQLMLHAHPRIAIPPETRYLMDVYQRRAEYGDLSDPSNTDRLLETMTGPETQFEDLGLDPEDVRKRLQAVAPTVGSALGVVMAMYAARWGKPRWGDKRPNYIRRLPFLLKMFPDAQILHIVRDGRDCVASLKEMPWWPYGTHLATYKWVEAMRVAEWARAALPADQYHELRYEDLVARPRAEIAKVCDFLSEPFDEAMLEPHQVAREAVPDYKDWHTRTHRRVDRQAVRQWKRKLDREEVRLIERVAGRMLRENGYRVMRGVRFRPPTPEDFEEYRRAERQQRTQQRHEQVEDEALEASYPWPVAADLDSIREVAADAPVAEASAH